MTTHTPTEFFCPSRLMENRITVTVIGAGGSGGEAMDRLVRLHFGLIKTGHPAGLDVKLIDGDTVSEANIGRQRFSPYDSGERKAELLIHRINMAYNLNWTAISKDYQPNTTLRDDLLITCIDKGKLRAEIARHHRNNRVSTLWLDFGNGQHTGQYILGHLSRITDTPLLLPNVYDLFPELGYIKDNDTPSCSFAEAIRNQDLMVNSVLVDQGINLLWQLLRHGRIGFNGGVVNVKDGTCKPLPINPETWAFFNPKLHRYFRKQAA
jgi:PRTRC genetic system ThiF family protein